MVANRTHRRVSLAEAVVDCARHEAEDTVIGTAIFVASLWPITFEDRPVTVITRESVTVSVKSRKSP